MTDLPGSGIAGRAQSAPPAGTALGAGAGRAAAAASVGQIAGLRPRRGPQDAGEVPGADVDLLDSLDPLTWRTVAAWLRERPSAATRQVRLRVLAAFLRWLREAEPSVELLAVTGAHLDTYCDAARAGALTIGVRVPGKPLASATVNRRRGVLSSFYAFAWRSGSVRHDRVAAPGTGVLTREDRRLLRQGVARLAAGGRHAEAAAVALLDATGAAADALAELTFQDLHPVAGDDLAIVTVHDSRGDIVAFPVPPPARPLLEALSSDRGPGEPLLRRDDGRPVDVEWLRDALAEAALAGGIPRQRAKLLHPYMLRAITAADRSPMT
ncbi:hypothetical protein E1267_23445 [Nonomuraea longispora]|uniref:Core-binding (CB) domain-containing protein n=1 Tax=Nonomuraea longispora TaxID=1848320 RepID=A0A4R4N5Y6_9ACTN|nr:hypothetical protein [Nonomuraea longispora]TDC04231.1 hypothetical protein E1267_23445 [Nonomuraea longispora]